MIQNRNSLYTFALCPSSTVSGLSADRAIVPPFCIMSISPPTLTTHFSTSAREEASSFLLNLHLHSQMRCLGEHHHTSQKSILSTTPFPRRQDSMAITPRSSSSTATSFFTINPLTRPTRPTNLYRTDAMLPQFPTAALSRSTDGSRSAV